MRSEEAYALSKKYTDGQIDGALTQGISEAVEDQAPAMVNDYCEEHFSEWEGALDDTFTQSNMAAPAKATGDAVNDLKSALTNLDIEYSYQYCDYANKETGKRYGKASESSVIKVDAENYILYPPFTVKAGTYYYNGIAPSNSFVKTSNSVTSFTNLVGSDNSGTITLNSDVEIYITRTIYLKDTAFSDNSKFPKQQTFGIYDRTYEGVDLIKDESELNGINIIPMASNSYSNGTLTITPTDGSYVFNNGTPSANGYYELYNGELPNGCYTGESYIITEFGFVHSGWVLEIHANVNDAWVEIYQGMDNAIMTVPQNAKSIRFRIGITKDVAWNGEAITIHGYSTKSTKYVATKLKWNYPQIIEKPIISIIDDDGNPKFYEHIVPIIQSKKVPIASAVITGWVGESVSEMTWEQIEDAYRKGAEILSHSDAHYEVEEWLALESNEIQYDYRISLNKIRNHGIKCNGLVYTGASGNYDKITNANKYVSDYGFRAGTNHTNLVGTDRYKIDRWSIDPESTLTNYTDKIDALVTAGTGWQVWMIHTSFAEFDSTSATVLAQAIDYALTNGIQIVTSDYGVSRYCV